MKNLSEIEIVLDSIVLLLNAAGEHSWSRSIAAAKIEFSTDPDHATSMIKGIFGGMGSFNDLVLHKDGMPLFLENELLSKLRGRLFLLVHD